MSLTEVAGLPAACEDLMTDFEIIVKFSLSNKEETYDPDMDEAPKSLVPSAEGGGFSSQQVTEV